VRYKIGDRFSTIGMPERTIKIIEIIDKLVFKYKVEIFHPDVKGKAWTNYDEIALDHQYKRITLKYNLDKILET